MTILFYLVLLFTFGVTASRRDKGLQAFSVERTLPLRGLLALLIVLHHVAQKVMKTDCANFFWDEMCDWGAPIVAVFFFMSGYGLAVSIKRKGTAYLQGFFKKRMVKIALPLVVCSLLYILDNQYIINVFGGGKTLTLGLDEWNKDYPLLPTAWFAVAILVYYAAFYVCARISVKAHHIVALMWLFTLAYIWLMHRYNFYGYWYRTVCAFNVGMTVSLFEPRVVNALERHKVSMLLLTAVTWLSVSAALEFHVLSGEVFIYVQNMFLAFLVYTLVVCLDFPESRALCWLGKFSYDIYLVQGAVILTLFGSVGDNAWLFALLSYAVSVPLAVAVNAVCRRMNNLFIEK